MENAVQVPAETVELRILRSLRRIMRAVDLHSRHLAKRYQITSPQLICLLAIIERGPMTATQLSREVHLSPSTLVGILDRLEQADLIRRERAVEDRRLVLLTATEQGRAFGERAPSPLQDRLAERLAALPEDERQQIAEVLDRVAELMGADHIDAAPLLESGSLSEQ